MTRHLCWVALLAVVTLPDWASACWPRWAARHNYYHSYSQPVYPLYSGYPVYPQYVPYSDCICPPAVAVRPMNPPRVEAVPKAAPSGMGTNVPRDPPSVIRPAGGSDNTLSPVLPTASVPNKPDSARMNEPLPLPKFPAAEAPKDLVGFPKLDVPKSPDFTPIPVPKEMPKNPGAAIPSAAPAPPEGLIPSPGVPELPDPKKAPLPGLTLPPVSPTGPKETIARSSPVTGERREMTVSVFPAGGQVLASGYKVVGFFNHTEHELSLTIEGQSVRLPAKNYLHAKLGPTFTWSHGNQPPVREAVPADASGLDVVFRE